MKPAVARTIVGAACIFLIGALGVGAYLAGKDDGRTAGHATGYADGLADQGAQLTEPPATASDALPPVDKREDTFVGVQFGSSARIATSCSGGIPGADACETRDGRRVPLLILPNPCAYQVSGDPYAILTCHELGHANGWPGNHPGGIEPSVGWGLDYNLNCADGWNVEWGTVIYAATADQAKAQGAKRLQAELARERRLCTINHSYEWPS